MTSAQFFLNLCITERLVLKCVFVFQMTTTSAHIWQSSETYRWNTGDVLGRGATAVVYKARNLVRYYTYMYTKLGTK